MSDEEIRHGLGAAARRAASHDVDKLMAGGGSTQGQGQTTAGDVGSAHHDLVDRPSEEEAKQVANTSSLVQSSGTSNSYCCVAAMFALM